jgi:hypothetical protein
MFHRLIRWRLGTRPSLQINCTVSSFLSEFSASFFLLFVMLAVPVIEFRIPAKVPQRPAVLCLPLTFPFYLFDSGAQLLVQEGGVDTASVNRSVAGLLAFPHHAGHSLTLGRSHSSAERERHRAVSSGRANRPPKMEECKINVLLQQTADCPSLSGNIFPRIIETSDNPPK